MNRSWYWASALALLGFAREGLAAPVQTLVLFDGEAQSANTSLDLAGSFTGGGGGTIGGAGPDQFHIQVPTQTVPLSLAAPGMIDRQPLAVAALGYDDATLGSRTVEGLQIDILTNQAITFDFNPLAVEGTAFTTADPTPIEVRIISRMSGSLLSLYFEQDEGLAENGTLTGNIWGYLLFEFGVSIEFPGPFELPVPLNPTLYGFNQPFSLPGDFTLTDLEPGAPGSRDALAVIAAAVDQLSFDIATTIPFNVNLGGLLPVAVSGELGFDVTATLGDFSYTLSTVLPDALAPMMLVGDANGDCSVGAADYALWAAQFGQTGEGLSADFDGSGSVGAGDYALWAANFGKTCPGAASPVPEPGSLALLGSGLAALWMAASSRRGGR